ncbi:MAG TPA: SMI1/KNR4 family protein [Gallionella sp.]|nr:SMI1/KNR4 family protein [Gallionella sp.]
MSISCSIVDEFVALWNANETLATATSHDVQELESTLGIKLPNCHVYLITKHGDLYAPNLLDAIVDKELELNDIQNFLLPNQMLEDTKAYEAAGMPEGYLVFASDCMGNMFCFKIDECKNQLSEPPIWFFDHDFVEIKPIANSFNEWLGNYVGL